MTEESLPESSDELSPSKGGSRAGKTPLFEANHASRYQRQTLINQIQESSERSLICYVSGIECMIDENDTMPFVDLLHKAPRNRDIDLLLHTPGGLVDAAEKLIGMMRSHVGEAELRIIIPDFAKSAGTVMVLGADRVLMSDMSELGPIDPQTRLFGRWQSVQNYLDAYAEHADVLKNDSENVASQIMLGKLDPATLIMFKNAVNRARQVAENLLMHGMFRNGGNVTKTVEQLLDTRRWLSHRQMISWEDAQDPLIGLSVEHYVYHSVEWQRYWRLYCLQRLAVGEQQKLFESDYASLTIGPAG